jgi:hypothetical protein
VATKDDAVEEDDAIGREGGKSDEESLEATQAARSFFSSLVFFL